LLETFISVTTNDEHIFSQKLKNITFGDNNEMQYELANNVLKSVPVNYHLQSLQTHITYIKQSHIRTLNQQLL